MSDLEHARARAAVVQAMRHTYIVPPEGIRVNGSIIDFTLIRRNDYDDCPVYRVRLEDDVLYGALVGSGEGVSP